MAEMSITVLDLEKAESQLALMQSLYNAELAKTDSDPNLLNSMEKSISEIEAEVNGYKAILYPAKQPYPCRVCNLIHKCVECKNPVDEKGKAPVGTINMVDPEV